MRVEYWCTPPLRITISPPMRRNAQDFGLWNDYFVEVEEVHSAIGEKYRQHRNSPLFVEVYDPTVLAYALTQGRILSKTKAPDVPCLLEASRPDSADLNLLTPVKKCGHRDLLSLHSFFTHNPLKFNEL